MHSFSFHDLLIPKIPISQFGASLFIYLFLYEGGGGGGCIYIFCNMTRNHVTLQLCPFHLPRLNFVIFYHYLPQISKRSTWLLKIWILQHFFQHFTCSASVTHFNILLIFSRDSTNLITKLPEKFWNFFS